MADLTELHNRMAGELTAAIILPIVTEGGTVADIMILTESVLVGVSLACIKLGGDNKVLDVMVDRARERLAEIRLGNLPADGRA